MCMKKTLQVISWNPLNPDRDIIINSIEYSNNTTLDDVFKTIESSMNIYSLSQYYTDYRWESFGNACPYVHVNGRVEWNVPYKRVKLVDFLKTHNIYNGILLVEVDCIGGDIGELFDAVLQGWLYIKPLLDAAGYALTIKDIIFGLKKAFSKKEKIPKFEEFKKYIFAKDRWDIHQLSYKTKVPENILKPILLEIGYEEIEGEYWKSAWKVNQYEKKQAELDYNEYISHYTGFDKKIDEYWAERINISLVYLYELSDEVDNQKTYNSVVNEVERMLEESEDKECCDLELNYILEETDRLEQILNIK